MSKDKNQTIEYEAPEQEMWMIREGAEQEYEVPLYTYEDYLTWPDDKRWELIDGQAIELYAPTRYHQKVSMNLAVEIGIYLKGKTCEVYTAPFDVRLSVGKGADTVVQPDILVFCDREILDDRGAKGAPDLVVEILSPSTRNKDCIVKLQKYEQYGVKEYWIVDPLYKKVTVHVLNTKGTYNAKEYKDYDVVTSNALSDFTISLETIFAD